MFQFYHFVIRALFEAWGQDIFQKGSVDLNQIQFRSESWISNYVLCVFSPFLEGLWLSKI